MYFSSAGQAKMKGAESPPKWIALLHGIRFFLASITPQPKRTQKQKALKPTKINGFSYSLALSKGAVSGCSGAVCGNLCGQKRFRPVPGELSPEPDRKRFSFQVVCIVTLSRRLCKWFLSRPQLKSCGAINKEIK